MSSPSKRDRPGGRLEQRAPSAAPSSTCRTRTRRRCRASRPGSPSAMTSSTAWTTPLPLREDALLDREPLGQVLDLDERAVAGPALGRRRRHARVSELAGDPGLPDLALALGESRQASRWPPGCWTSGGRFVSQGSNLYRQRGWNGQPGGGLSSDGGEPSIGTQRRRAASRSSASTRAAPTCTGAAASVKISRGGPVLHRAAGVHHHHVRRGLGDDAEVVGDQDHADVELAASPGRSARGSAPGRSRRGRSSARRRSARPGCGRAPSRSSRAGACRPRTGAGSRFARLAAFGIPTAPSSSTARSHACFFETSSWARTASAIWSPTRYIGWRQANGSWKIIETSRPRTWRSSFGDSFRRSRALEEDLAGDVGGRRVEQAHDREARDALARAGLADDAERLAAPEREREVRDRLDDPVARAEADRQVADVEQHDRSAKWPPLRVPAPVGRGTRRRCRRRGS